MSRDRHLECALADVDLRTPMGFVRDMEAVLRQAEASAEATRGRILPILCRPGVEIPGAEAADFLAAFEKALGLTRVRDQGP